MDTFFNFLKQSLVAMLFVIFGLAATYIPQPHGHNIERAEALATLTGAASEITQLGNNALLGSNVGNTAATAATSLATSINTASLWVKEQIGDGLAWQLAKQAVSVMMRDVIDWVNSGFQGKPAFVQNMKDYLFRVGDGVLGDFVVENFLGGDSFICSPFRLDVQIAITQQYSLYRNEQPAPTCTLSGIFNNLDSFISGTFSSGGWNDWLNVTAKPSQYTPYGSYLVAQETFQARLINAQGEEKDLLGFADGFLSSKVCKKVGTKRTCEIVAPGKIFAEQLHQKLGAPQDVLITADEMTELIGALFGQFTNTLFQGTASALGFANDPGSPGGINLNTGANNFGTLGLNNNASGYTYSGFGPGGFIDNAIATDNINAVAAGNAAINMNVALNVQRQMTQRVGTLIPQLNAARAATVDPNRQAEIDRLLTQANNITAQTTGVGNTPGSIALITTAISSYSNAVTPAEQQNAFNAFTSIPKFTQNDINAFTNAVAAATRPDTVAAPISGNATLPAGTTVTNPVGTGGTGGTGTAGN